MSFPSITKFTVFSIQNFLFTLLSLSCVKLYNNYLVSNSPDLPQSKLTFTTVEFQLLAKAVKAFNLKPRADLHEQDGCSMISTDYNEVYIYLFCGNDEAYNPLSDISYAEKERSMMETLRSDLVSKKNGDCLVGRLIVYEHDSSLWGWYNTDSEGSSSCLHVERLSRQSGESVWCPAVLGNYVFNLATPSDRFQTSVGINNTRCHAAYLIGPYRKLFRFSSDYTYREFLKHHLPRLISSRDLSLSNLIDHNKLQDSFVTEEAPLASSITISHYPLPTDEI